MKSNFNIIETFVFSNTDYKLEEKKNTQYSLSIKRSSLNRLIPFTSNSLTTSQLYLHKEAVKTVMSGIAEASLQFKKIEPQLYLAQLRLVGIGYRVFQFCVNNKEYLIFDLGSSKLTIVYVPSTIRVRAEKSSILVYGDSLNSVRNFWSNIANLKKPDVYKGKGIQKVGVVYKLKEGKKK
jgi:ribosomal protein L6P/L9E